MSLADFALTVAGMPANQIADVDKAMPGFARIAAAVKQAEPIITQAKPHLDALEPLLIQLWPILQKAWPDIVADTPAATELIDFVETK